MDVKGWHGIACMLGLLEHIFTGNNEHSGLRL
ncbi:Uncharacterised protein [Salmonella enterica subsp. enterica serovar Typhi]|nr:Uncharacterised protein [Salmonella enterica subsp. enterica serovar Typhi]